MSRPGRDPRPGRRRDLDVRPGESDPTRGLGVALLCAGVSALLIVAVVVLLVWGAS